MENGRFPIHSTELFQSPNNIDIPQIKKEFEMRFYCEFMPQRTSTISFFDTFDQRIYLNGNFLYQKNNFLILDQNNKQIHYKISPAFSHKQFFLSSDLKNSDLKKRVTKIAQMRALIKLFQFPSISNVIFFKGQDETILFSLEFLQILFIENEENKSLLLINISAADKKNALYREFIHWFVSLYQLEERVNLYQSICEHIPVEIPKQSCRKNIILNAENQVAEELKRVFLNLNQKILENREGVISDFDTEFLHDFRVALRQIRSALTLFKDIFPENERLIFKQRFSELAKMTNRLRDLDVYLLNKEVYQSWLTDDLIFGLELFFRKIKRERTIEFKKVRSFFQQSVICQLIDDWEAFLDSDLYLGSTKRAEVLLKDYSEEKIRKKYKKAKIIMKGIHKNTSDNKLHKLRVECKRLRYMINFFKTIYPPKKVKVLIKYLKELQDSLGLFNDYFVQIIHLQSHLKSLNKNSKYIVEEAVAIGGLLTLIQEKKKNTKNDVLSAIDHFRSEQMNKFFKDLFV